MNAAEFRVAFPGEGQLVEFKRGTSGEQLQNTAVAFSNADGGVILIGVADDGAVVGRQADAGTQDAIHQAMQAARDVGRYAIHPVDVGGTAVCVLAIARRREGFAQTSAGIVRVRQGTRDDALFSAELVRFANERTSSRYETTPVAPESATPRPNYDANLAEHSAGNARPRPDSRKQSLRPAAT